MGLARLLELRRGRRGAVTKRINGLSDAVTSNNESEIKISIALLEDCVRKITDLDEQVLEQRSEEELEAEILEQDILQENITRALMVAKRLCTPCRRRPLAESSSVSVSSTKGGPQLSYRLPKLIIKPFNGDILLWATFWEHFGCPMLTLLR